MHGFVQTKDNRQRPHPEKAEQDGATAHTRGMQVQATATVLSYTASKQVKIISLSLWYMDVNLQSKPEQNPQQKPELDRQELRWNVD